MDSALPTADAGNMMDYVLAAYAVGGVILTAMLILSIYRLRAIKTRLKEASRSHET